MLINHYVAFIYLTFSLQCKISAWRKAETANSKNVAASHHAEVKIAHFSSFLFIAIFLAIKWRNSLCVTLSSNVSRVNN